MDIYVNVTNEVKKQELDKFESFISDDVKVG